MIVSPEPGDRLILAEIHLEKCRVLSEAGKSAMANEILEETLTRLREIEAVNNLQPDVQRKLQVLLSNGLVQRVRLSQPLSNPGQTLELMTEAIQHGERAYKSQPTDREAVIAYAKALEELGGFYHNLGRFDLFEEPVRKALTLLHKAAGEAPADIGLQQRSERAVAHWGALLTIVDLQEGKLRIPGESLELLRKLSAMDPRNVDLLKDLVNALENCGSILTNQKEYETGKKLLKEAVEIGKRLIDEKKSGFELEDNVQLCAFALSICYSRTGDLEAARKVNLESLAPLTERLATLDLDKSNNRFRAALCCLAQAETAAGEDKWEEAQETISRGLRSLEKNLYIRNYVFDKVIYADSLVEFGRASGKQGNSESGSAYIERGLQILCALRDNGRNVPRTEILSDIAEAEGALRECKQGVKNSDFLAPSDAR
jgi:tetratricopeptide (TPR) repeat protein